MQKLYKQPRNPHPSSPISPTPFPPHPPRSIFGLTCWQSTWIQCNIFEYRRHECMYIIQCQTANVLRWSMTGVHAKMWKHFAVGQIDPPPHPISGKRLILKDTIQKKKKNPEKKNKSNKQAETIEPYTIIYILLRIMEAKYVYRVAFGKPVVEYLHCFFYREGSFTDDSQFCSGRRRSLSAIRRN